MIRENYLSVQPSTHWLRGLTNSTSNVLPAYMGTKSNRTTITYALLSPPEDPQKSTTIYYAHRWSKQRWSQEDIRCFQRQLSQESNPHSHAHVSRSLLPLFSRHLFSTSKQSFDTHTHTLPLEKGSYSTPQRGRVRPFLLRHRRSQRLQANAPREDDVSEATRVRHFAECKSGPTSRHPSPSFLNAGSDDADPDRKMGRRRSHSYVAKYYS